MSFFSTKPNLKPPEVYKITKVKVKILLTDNDFGKNEFYYKINTSVKVMKLCSMIRKVKVL